jgi:hypothetical protein
MNMRNLLLATTVLACLASIPSNADMITPAQDGEEVVLPSLP